MSEVAIRGIDVHTYLVKDPKRAIAFYRDVMQLTPAWEADQGAEFELPDGATFGLWKMDDGSWAEGTGVMFAVGDCSAAADYYRARGAKVSPAQDIGHCWMAFAEDTEGNHQASRMRATHTGDPTGYRRGGAVVQLCGTLAPKGVREKKSVLLAHFPLVGTSYVRDRNSAGHMLQRQSLAKAFVAGEPATGGVAAHE